MTDDKLDEAVSQIDCGFSLSQESSSSEVVRNVSLSKYNGTVNIDYSVISGSINVSVVYNESEVINQTVTGVGTLSFDSDTYGVHECLLTLTPTNATYTLDFGCVQSQELTVVRIVKNSSLMSNKIIHHDFFWSDNGLTSPVVTDLVTFEDGPVSLYKTFTAVESSGSTPADGGVVTMRYRKEPTDDAVWDIDKFKYLVSDTLYQEGDIDTLIPLMQEATPISNPSTDVYEASFTYSNPSNFQYLYLVWDYVDALNSFFASSTARLSSSLACEDPIVSTYYTESFDPVVDSVVYTDPQGTTFMPQGFYSFLTGWMDVDANGVITSIGSCENSNPPPSSGICEAIWISDDNSNPDGTQDLITGFGLYYALDGVIVTTPFNGLLATPFQWEGVDGKLFFVCSSVKVQYYQVGNEGSPDALPTEFYRLTNQDDGQGGTIGGGSCTSNGSCSL